MTEDMQLVTSPGNEFTALYENAVCRDSPDVLQSKIWIARGDLSMTSPRSRVLLAHAPITYGAIRPTQPKKMSINWSDATTLIVRLADDVKVESKATPTSEMKLRIVINRREVISTEAIRQLVALEPSDLSRVLILFKFANNDEIREEAVALLYRNFGKQEFLPVIDAIWNQTESAYPLFDWQSIRSEKSRIEMSALWGQWRREFLSDTTAALEAALFVRPHVNSASHEIRLAAITALGSVGTIEDRAMLAPYVLSEDTNLALRAVSAIHGIERVAKPNDSLLVDLRSSATNPRTLELISQLLSQRAMSQK